MPSSELVLKTGDGDLVVGLLARGPVDPVLGVTHAEALLKDAGGLIADRVLGRGRRGRRRVDLAGRRDQVVEHGVGRLVPATRQVVEPQVDVARVGEFGPPGTTPVEPGGDAATETREDHDRHDDVDAESLATLGDETAVLRDHRAQGVVALEVAVTPEVANSPGTGEQHHSVTDAHEFDVGDLAPGRLPRDGRDARELGEPRVVEEQSDRRRRAVGHERWLNGPVLAS